MHKTTLEQWSLLQSLVDFGSFALAARAMNRSQSSVSYNISLLQERLGVALLQPEGRRAVLTPAGELLLAQVRPLLRDFQQIEQRAAALKRGQRARIDLVVDSIYPRARLFEILRQFQQRHPLTQVHLTEVLNSESPAKLAQRPADLLVLTRNHQEQDPGQWLMNVDFVAVAHPQHPLHSLPVPLTSAQLNHYPLIKITDQLQQDQQQPAALAESWTFTTIEAAIEAVAHQVGYGWLPAERIAPLLDHNELKVLPLKHGVRRTTALHLILRQQNLALDPEIATLTELFTQPGG
ncbi:LysR family transcriptional regulator [Winslowiella iniecta]|uniref:LysR family transcriptional regulator n=1 Tax=Winslowiella iniecta TaxID=1560201 RepID=A0A0L7SXM0_9GAMM|nr:LysR family transcriptional regulator [Winslowiella iniecta]KOC87706.1 LysR family transcriptional regulator [Winslowiella iniecta]KOC89888.1 LysR family transcriptional regulator [Winslowiella iniecta]